MDDLIAWLRAQLDEDERVARAASPGPWRVSKSGGAMSDGNGNTLVENADGAWGVSGDCIEPDDAAHIARHDPVRVLADIDAKRRILDRSERRTAQRAEWFRPEDSPISAIEVDTLDLVVEIIASAYADRPGYQPEWRPA